MQILKTDKTTLTDDEILKYISDYELAQVPEFDKLWQYYKAKNTVIMERPPADPNNPNNKVPVPYGRKIITTFTGYAYRPRYITYKAVEEKAESEEETDNIPIGQTESTSQYSPESQTNIETGLKQEATIKLESFKKYAPSSPAEAYMKELQNTFDINNEHIKTSRAGRNTGIFGVAYELLYVKGEVNKDKKTNSTIPLKAEPRFFSVDPREMILIYDYSSEPEKVMAIHFYKINEDKYKVEMYYKDKIIIYDRIREKDATTGGTKWILIKIDDYPNFYEDIPVPAYYFGDDMLGIIQPVLSLIDAYDKLISGAMDEDEKFAKAYLVMKEFGITDPIKKKEPGVISQALQNMKKKRVFEHVPKDADIYYLTKDIPTEFIEFMTKKVKDEIHTQSHVPDFKDMATGTLSGAAIQRMLFDFENVVSSAEADFDVGLLERIKLISTIYGKIGRATGTQDMISISHKRNLPADLAEKAETANNLKAAGFSRYLIADIMPDDIIPDVDEELKRQDEDNAALMPDIEAIPEPEEEEDVDADGNPIDAQGYLIDENGDRILDNKRKPKKGKV